MKMNFFEEYHELLSGCNKPYQYVGGEFLSCNKSFEDAKVRFAFAFPDKYEIGISNLGVRVLYGVVNNCKDFMADRVYAPEKDFKESLLNSKKELYSLESKIALKNFDAIGFSLQYELAYPTVLAMLNMSDIAIKNENRKENDPIIIAGGPCAFNPLPMVDFIDAFIIGDGEDVILQVCDVIKTAKELNVSRDQKLKMLSDLEGVYVPKYSKKTRKRIAQLSYENALKSYPIPFSASVHDRATIEIRRGCGRMCRFCQPGHVTLPVRERSAEDIIKITKELVNNTGYDEYSLLSLSSNDYSNIKEVIKELSVDFEKKKVSVSLPSQRIDGFNLELANLVQSVRKSAMTLAPEAGSQRMRDVIKKNITREQIIDAALTLYENGWSRIKFYFIVGLPTETYQDLDEMAQLLDEIRYKSRYIKKIKELKHSLDITCTLSIFVPKPFTPFQWAPQVDIEEITKRIHYLKDKTKHVKGLKINYHEQFVSQVEAVLTRGDESLCKYIEALFNKGCYLDAWGEHFDKEAWMQIASECDIDLKELATKEYSLEENLPWEIIDVGLNKTWLQDEYIKALSTFESPNIQPTCENTCVDCGVCKNLKTRKKMDTPYETKIETIQNQEKEVPPRLTHIAPITYRYRIKLTKKGHLRYFSHLDWQGTFLKALARTGLDIAFSQGFNPTMKVSLGIALPLFIESDCEFVDIELSTSPKIEIFENMIGEFQDEKEFRNSFRKKYKSNFQGKIIKSSIGDIKFSKKGLKKTLSSSADINKLKLLPKLEDIILAGEMGELCNLNKKRDDDITGFRWIKTIVTLENQVLICYVTLAQTIKGIYFYNININKNVADAIPANTKTGDTNNTTIINDLSKKYNPEDDYELKILKLKLEQVVPEGCEILEIKKMDKSALSIDYTVQWAEYKVSVVNKGLHNFEDLVYNLDKVLSSDEILLTKKNKKGILKTINIKTSIKSYEFKDESLFIILKTGQSSEIPAVRADDLMKVMASDILFDIKRTRFFDENVKEL